MTDEPSQPQPAAAPRGRLARLAKYASWTAVDQFIELGFPNLILLPILLAVLGEHVNGILLLGLACVRFVGISPSNGLASYIMRDAAHQAPAGQQDLLRTVLVLSVVLMLPITALFAICVGVYAGRVAQPGLITLLPWFAIFLVCLNLTHTVVTLFRYRRTFHKMVAVHAVQGVLQFLAIPLYYQFGLAGIGPAFAIAGVGGLAYACWLEREALFRRPLYRAEFARSAMRVWLPVAVSSLLVVSAGSLDRLVLGGYWEPAVVTVFFAAAAAARVMLIPGMQAYNLLFSLLGKTRDSGHFSRTFYLRYLAGSLLLSAGIIVGGWLVGGWIVAVLYRSVAAEATPLVGWTMAAAGGLSLHGSLRPFVNKFLPPAYLPWMAGASVICRLVPLFLLVPGGGALGAAQAMLIGSWATAGIWLSVYTWSFILSGQVHSSRVSETPAAAEADSGSRSTC